MQSCHWASWTVISPGRVTTFHKYGCWPHNLWNLILTPQKSKACNLRLFYYLRNKQIVAHQKTGTSFNSFKSLNSRFKTTSTKTRMKTTRVQTTLLKERTLAKTCSEQVSACLLLWTADSHCLVTTSHCRDQDWGKRSQVSTLPARLCADVPVWAWWPQCLLGRGSLLSRVPRFLGGE